ncbi:ribosomal protein S18 acetylase RimI-like enzyme [Actinoalloteichus hoggarensis]|uniref:Mycothiol acetyltransferase n=1 Tax=Actinoalloteichus hoggarensis TaxID=1470176 RepID=A0A221W7B1_9PSEU|nr:GNAT family N-acetyltransferase [Actinoalloteichus hoggarensis]ASO21870.1 Mycothiol acetyltransferase [Actinoalloteichus hoggarensis]MBB5922468.1 ribosomal protein S18 acetylase RimI-like enzyme [Actinoalloteichus hoggarensis]
MITPPDVRPATEADVPRATQTLGAAFGDYPYTRHVVDERDHLRRVTRFQELFLTEVGLPHGRVWVADGGDAVAVWTTPDAEDIGAVFARLGPEFAELAGERAAASAAAEAALAPHRPTEPAWFLGTVGVHPDSQGRGLGTAVLRPGIEAAEAAGVTAFLETSTERNVAFYRRLGFVVTADVALPDGGPRTWCMARAPIR